MGDTASANTPPAAQHRRYPLILLALAAVICLATVYAPAAGRTSWLLEVGPGLLGIAVLIATYRRAPLSHWVYGCVFLHLLILIYGGYYTYAETPLGNWAKDVFGFARNHYDRVGHVALGVFPAFVIREVLLRATPLTRGGWLYFITLSIVLAIAAFWELLEWWVTLLVASDVGQAFLGSQGDVWDAQWDMFLALLGAAFAVPVFKGAHDRSMARVPRPPPTLSPLTRGNTQ
jgi:putative membrane protein